ncbi:uncharacterized protein DDB_G0290301-like [Mugil cephalus]|uniref:uncharacterized protein DDB_G0290301-like n=1 Tax=Mugil cephalus TaxID=48193 RepID=UPI001FB7FC20|nr:uncharacterized protein DDB_G0290301-like [Mugil cephalus]
MFSNGNFSESIIKPITAAPEQIFEKTVVQSEEDVDHQGKLLDITWKPEMKLHKTDLPQQHVCMKEEVLTEQQLCSQERNSSLDQEEQEPPQIKEEQEDLQPPQLKEEYEEPEFIQIKRNRKNQDLYRLKRNIRNSATVIGKSILY